jgi:hypothetical protein
MSLAGLEPAATRLEGERSCPTELQAHAQEGDGESRTHALSFTRRLLCRLSYIAVWKWSGRAETVAASLHGRARTRRLRAMSRAPSKSRDRRTRTFNFLFVRQARSRCVMSPRWLEMESNHLLLLFRQALDHFSYPAVVMAEGKVRSFPLRLHARSRCSSSASPPTNRYSRHSGRDSA